MPDFEQILGQQRNQLLNPQRTRGDVIRAGIQATTGIPYQQAIQGIEGQKFDRALQGYNILSAERDFQSRREQQLWERAQVEAQRGDDNAARLLELSGAYGATAADAQRLAAAVMDRAEADNVDDAGMLPGLVAEEANRLGLAARPDLTLMSTAGGGVTGIDPLGQPRTIVPGQTEAPKPYTDIGKINADLNAGLITPAQALQAAQGDEQWRTLTAEERATYGIPEGQPAQIGPDGKVQTIGSGGITLYDREGNIQAQVGGFPLTGSQEGKQAIEIAEAVRSANTRLSELSTALNSLRETPEAAGISGVVIENVGGVLQQITDLAGVDGDWLPTQDVQRTRTELSSLLGQYIPTITGDTSGRYSDQDMRRAQAALPATRPIASFDQVQEALLTLRDIEERSRVRNLMRADGFDPSVDITYQDGRNRYATQLMREGKTIEEAADIISDMLRRYDLSLAVVGIQ